MDFLLNRQKPVEKDKYIKVFVNGKSYLVEELKLTYAKLCAMAKKNPEHKPDITYSFRTRNEGGCLSAGEEVTVEKNMLFDVAATSNA